jgi:hypothetical protein
MLVTGPNGEQVGLNFIGLAVDSTSPAQGGPQKDGAKSESADYILYPAKVDLAKAFPDLVQEWRRVNGFAPAELHLDHAEPMTALHGVRCVHVTGQFNPDGKGMQQWDSLLCTSPPVQGKYMVQRFNVVLSNGVADREHATTGAIR